MQPGPPRHHSHQPRRDNPGIAITALTISAPLRHRSLIPPPSVHQTARTGSLEQINLISRRVGNEEHPNLTATHFSRPGFHRPKQNFLEGTSEMSSTNSQHDTGPRIPGRAPKYRTPPGHRILHLAIPSQTFELLHIQAIRSQMEFTAYMQRFLMEAFPYDQPSTSPPQRVDPPAGRNGTGHTAPGPQA
jgi:hypothetical protein